MRWATVKRYIPLFCIILLAVCFRFVYLDRIPNAISGDELLYAITSKSVFLTGHDISGTWNPLSVFLFRYPPDEQQAELPYFLHLMFGAAFPFSLFMAKLPFALLSVGIVILLYGIARKLFGTSVGIATGLIAAVNPWLVVMGRTGYESTPATFFYLLAIWILISASSWSIIWSFIPLILAFYSYIGTKLIFIPFVFLAALLGYITHKRQYAKQYTLLFVLGIVWTGAYVFLILTSPTESRISDLMLPNAPAIVSQVNEIRKTAIQSALLPLMINKYTTYVEIVFSKLCRIFSPTYLFIEGDQFFLPLIQGFFYYVDIVFLLIGALALFAKNRRYFSILCGFIIVGTLPHVFFHNNTGDFSGHLALMFPFLIILIGIGIRETLQIFGERMRTLTISLVVALYILNIANFSMVYFTQYPLKGIGDFPMHILSRYLYLTRQQNVPLTVYSSQSGDLFKIYLFYTNAMTNKTMPDISRINTNLPFSFNGIHFTDCDQSIHEINFPGTVIIDTTCAMKVTGTSIHIARLIDGGQVYRIFQDHICSDYHLYAYPSGLRMNDFTVEQLPIQRFCEVYISR